MIQRLDALRSGAREAGIGGGAGSLPVVTIGEGDDVSAAGRDAGDSDRGVDRLSTRTEEGELLEPAPERLEESSRIRRTEWVRREEGAETPASLSSDRLGDVRMRVADVRDQDARGEVDDLPTIHRGDEGTVRLGPHEVVVGWRCRWEQTSLEVTDLLDSIHGSLHLHPRSSSSATS